MKNCNPPVSLRVEHKHMSAPWWETESSKGHRFEPCQVGHPSQEDINIVFLENVIILLDIRITLDPIRTTEVDFSPQALEDHCSKF
ncbi:unnamed protein product [Prunus armeniaca]